MTNGSVFLAIGTIIAATDLVIAQVAARKIRERAAMPPIEGGRQGSPAAIVAMLRIGAVVIFLILAALAFGLIPAADIQPIKLH